MDVWTALIANPQAAELMQPGQRPLHHPTVDAQSAAMGRAPLRQLGFDALRPQRLPMALGIIGPVAQDALGPAAGAAPLAFDRRDGGHQGQQLGHVMPVGCGQEGRQGKALPIGDDVMLAAPLAAVGGVGPRFPPRPPQPARRNCPPRPPTRP